MRTALRRPPQIKGGFGSKSYPHLADMYPKAWDVCPKVWFFYPKPWDRTFFLFSGILVLIPRTFFIGCRHLFHRYPTMRYVVRLRKRSYSRRTANCWFALLAKNGLSDRYLIGRSVKRRKRNTNYTSLL